jgi:hypothetical protein
MENDDVFDSVTWETPTVSNGYDATLIEASDVDDAPHSGPGFRHLGDDGGPPHEPKWEGYLITQVFDPMKELDGTKDMFVSYQVSAKVCVFFRIKCIDWAHHFNTLRPTYPYLLLRILLHVADSRTSSSSGTTLLRTFLLAWFRQYLTSIA